MDAHNSPRLVSQNHNFEEVLPATKLACHAPCTHRHREYKAQLRNYFRLVNQDDRLLCELVNDLLHCVCGTSSLRTGCDDFSGSEYFHKPESEFHYILNNLETHNKKQRGCLRQPASDSDNCTGVCAHSNSQSQPHLDQVHLGIHFVGSVKSNVNSVHFVQTQLHQQERSVRKILLAGTSFKDNLRISNEGQKVFKSAVFEESVSNEASPASTTSHLPEGALSIPVASVHLLF
jgi:hypothetical protein